MVTIAKLLGHALVETTERYVHLSVRSVADATDWVSERIHAALAGRERGGEPECPSSKQMGLLSVFHKGGSGSSLFDVKPLGVDGSSGCFGWSVF